MRRLAHTVACALIAVILSQSEVPAQAPDSGANPKARVPPQLPPVPPSPVDYFRKLLNASPAERDKLLEGKSPESRRVLTNNVRTYLSLSPEEREQRLWAMELRFHLSPLLQVAPSNRAERLALVPETYREVVRERLSNCWDRLAPELQKQLLDSAPVIRDGSVIQARSILPPMPPVRSSAPRGVGSNQQAAAESAISRWQSYPEAKRREITASFERLFGQPKKENPLDPLPLSAAERDQMEKTLATYRQMTPMQRSSCVNAFKKFAEMSAAERRQFLRNAEAWQAMSAEDRERWRHIVSKLPPLPPLPPGFGTPMPPIPPAPSPSRSTLVASNSPPGQ